MLLGTISATTLAPGPHATQWHKLKQIGLAEWVEAGGVCEAGWLSGVGAVGLGSLAGAWGVVIMGILPIACGSRKAFLYGSPHSAVFHPCDSGTSCMRSSRFEAEGWAGGVAVGRNAIRDSCGLPACNFGLVMMGAGAGEGTCDMQLCQLCMLDSVSGAHSLDG